MCPSSVLLRDGALGLFQLWLLLRNVPGRQSTAASHVAYTCPVYFWFSFKPLVCSETWELAVPVGASACSRLPPRRLAGVGAAALQPAHGGGLVQGEKRPGLRSDSDAASGCGAGAVVTAAQRLSLRWGCREEPCLVSRPQQVRLRAPRGSSPRAVAVPSRAILCRG